VPRQPEDEVTKVAGCTTTAESSCRRRRRPGSVGLHHSRQPRSRPESRTTMWRSGEGRAEELVETPDPCLSIARTDDAVHQIDAPDATAQVRAAQPRSSPLGPDRACERWSSPLGSGLRKEHRRLPYCLAWLLRHLEPPPRQASDLHLHAQGSSRRLFARRRAVGVCTHRPPPLADGCRHHRRCRCQRRPGELAWGVGVARVRGASRVARASDPGGHVNCYHFCSHSLLFKQVTKGLQSTRIF
jgi:hypothetical protein